MPASHERGQCICAPHDQAERVTSPRIDGAGNSEDAVGDLGTCGRGQGSRDLIC